MASGSKKVIYAALLGNSAIAVTKFGASILTGSSAMLTEAIHSLVDTGNQVLLLLGLRRARKPADEDFPFGHGKEIYFWSFVVAISIFAVGAGVSIYEGIKHLMHPAVVTDPHVNYIVLGLAMVFEGFAWAYAFREFRAYKGELGWFEAVHHGKDPTLFVVLFEDTAAMAGLVIAFLGVLLGELTGNPLWDGTASVGIGLVLATVAIWLAYETKGLLIGESAARSVRGGIRRILEEDERITTIHELLTLQMGPERVVANVSVDFSRGLSGDEVEQATSELQRKVRGAVPQVIRVFIVSSSGTGEPGPPGS